MKQRVFYLLKFYVVTVILFVVAKVFFIIYHISREDLSFLDFFQVIRHGLSLDLSMTLYLLIVPFLLVMASLWVRIPKWVFRIYDGIIAFLLSLAFVADTSLYEFWQFKLDASCLSYLETPTEAMASVSTGYILIRLLCVLLASLVIYWIYDILTPLFSKLNSLSQKLIATLIFLLLIPLIIIGIRGGVDESTTNIGQVYYSQNQFLNHAAVNPVFSFIASFENTASYDIDYHFMDERECASLLDHVFQTNGTDTDTLLTTTKPNIIIILMESAGGVFTEIGGRTDIMPNLNRLSYEGINFCNCYGNSWRTDRGTVCTWSGYPSFPTLSVMKIPSKSRTLPNIARSLKEERGYTTHYLYGGDINFTNMRSYLVSGGFEQLTWKNDYTKEEQLSAEWGVRDDITFRTLFDLTTQLQQPFVIGYSTLSSHQPWDVPIQHFDDDILNCFDYVDQCIGDFVAKLRKTTIWDNTLIILLPDHGIIYEDIDETKQIMNHIPMIWVGGAVKEPRRIEKICNQTDLPATLLAQLGIPYDHFKYSRDVLGKNYTYPVAIHTYNNGFSMVDSTGFVVFDLNVQRTIVNTSNDAERLVRLGKAILQTAADDLKKLGTNQ